MSVSQQVQQHLTLSDRLSRLRSLRHAWRTLDWTRCVTVPISGPCCAYELVGGIFCKTQPRRLSGSRTGGDGGVGGAFANAFGFMDADDEEDAFMHGIGDGNGDFNGNGDEDVHHVFGSRTLSATWLPGTDDGGRTEVREDLGIPTRDFAIDPSQDLMVLFKSGEDAAFPMAVVFAGTLELHVRTISTNEAHPRAKSPVLRTPVLYPVTSVCVHIADDVVGVMYCIDPARPRITVWNWHTGKLVVDCSGAPLPPGTWDFSFINSRALFVTSNHDGGSLELFSFACDRDLDTNANASTDTDDDDSEMLTPTQPEPAIGLGQTVASRMTHVASLRLPPVQPSVRVQSVATHTGPFVGGCLPDKPFVASNEERIHALTVQYIHLPAMEGLVTRPRVCAFLHGRTLEGYLERGGTSEGEGVGANETATAPALVVPWSEWGPKHVRMIHQPNPFQWLRYVHGQRVVLLLPGTEPGKSTIQVLDFNPYTVFDADEDREEEEIGGLQTKSGLLVERMDYPTRLDMPEIFTDVVETGLAYREVRREVRGHYSGVMIDDERLIGLKYPAFLTGDMKEIDVFTM